MKNSFKILLSIIILLLSTSAFAVPNENALDESVVSDSIQNEGIINETILDMENATSSNIEEENVWTYEFKEVINLPSLFRQNTFHPYPQDFYGIGEDKYPIMKVQIEEDDEERKNCMAITFDSAYINDYTFKILDILDEYNVKSTFFMTLEFMKNNPTHVMEIVKRGHEIGNHTTKHPDLNTISDNKVIAEVMQCHYFMQALTGVDMCMFRFPYGSFSPRTLTLIKNMGYYPIQWTFDSIDWRNDGTEFLLKRFAQCQELKEGSIILFHNGASFTPEALPAIIQFIQSKGLKLIKVSDLIYKHDYEINFGTMRKKNLNNE